MLVFAVDPIVRHDRAQRLFGGNLCLPRRGRAFSDYEGVGSKRLSLHARAFSLSFCNLAALYQKSRFVPIFVQCPLPNPSATQLSSAPRIGSRLSRSSGASGHASTPLR